jgi:MerR family mercuric resistance operon transcriptional regulator
VLLALDPDDRAAARALAETRIAAIDERIATLLTMRAALDKLAQDCARGEAGPCPILAAFAPPLPESAEPATRTPARSV